MMEKKLPQMTGFRIPDSNRVKSEHTLIDLNIFDE